MKTREIIDKSDSLIIIRFKNIILVYDYVERVPLRSYSVAFLFLKEDGTGSTLEKKRYGMYHFRRPVKARTS